MVSSHDKHPLLHLQSHLPPITMKADITSEAKGTLLQNSNGKIGTLKSTKKGKTYRAFKHNDGNKIWFGSTLQEKTDEEIKVLLPTIEVSLVTSVEDGVTTSNFVAFIDAWTWE